MLHGDCSLDYFHSSDPGCFHEALGHRFSQAFEKEKELYVPPKRKKKIGFFFMVPFDVYLYAY